MLINTGRLLTTASAAIALGVLGGCAAPSAPAEPTVNVVGTVRTMFIGPMLSPCHGVVPMQCMMFRYTPTDEWLYFYSQIEGFTFEPGYNYELQVIERPVADPPADAPSIRYELRRMVSKTRA